MNFEINENQSFYSLISGFCTKYSDQVWDLNNDLGKGRVYFYNPYKGLMLFMMDVYFKNPFLVRWNLEPTRADEFYLAMNSKVKTVDNLNSKKNDEELIEEGVVLFSKGRERRRLWMPDTHYKICMINFTYEWIENVHQLIPISNKTMQYLQYTRNAYLSINNVGGLGLIVNQLFQHVQKQFNADDLSYFQLKSIEFVSESLKIAFSNVNNIKSNKAIHPDDLNQIMNVVNNLPNQLHDPPYQQALADLLGMSLSKFQRSFKQIMGTSYYKYLLNIRMLKAMELLMQQQSVSSVSVEVGYSSIGNFTQAFKSHYGILPSTVK